MAVRAELEELVKWISDLQKAKGPAPADPVKPSRDDWLKVERALNSVAERLGEAREELITQFPRSVVKEFALDVQREARGLALRAHLLAFRVKRADKPKKTEDEDEEKRRRAARPPAPPEVEKPKAPSDIVGRVGNTLAEAQGKLADVTSPDDATKAFRGELDVLAEMTLALREHCLELDGGKPPVVAAPTPPAEGADAGTASEAER